MRQPLSLLSGVAVLAVAASAQAAPRTYATDGSVATEELTYDASTKVVAPKAGGPYPLIIASHGWSASGDNQLGWAEHFASYGFVVAVPTFPSSFNPDTDVNAGIIEDLVTQLTGAKAAQYKVKPGAYGVEGHSAGGLATTVAAAKLKPAAVVLFDPVDKDARGKAAYATLCSPTLAIFAESSSCNNDAGWMAFGATTTADLVRFKVKGSTHCDGESNARQLCGPFCGGGADPTRQKIYSHYATAFFLAKLTGDASATSALQQTTLASDTDLDGAATAAGTCSPQSSSSSGDGGTTSSSSGTSGSSTSSSSSSTGGAAPSASSSSSGGTDGASSSGESGCTVSAPTSAPRALLVPGLLALGALVARRRRHARG